MVFISSCAMVNAARMQLEDDKKSRKTSNWGLGQVENSRANKKSGTYVIKEDKDTRIRLMVG
jgi:hypothetical protein